MEHEETDLHAWTKRTGTSAAKLSAEVIRRGGKGSAKYIEHVVNGNYEPGWRLCFIFQAITGVDACVIKAWPYRRAPKKKASPKTKKRAA